MNMQPPSDSPSQAAPTPRTDKLSKWEPHVMVDYVVPSTFARDLERELSSSLVRERQLREALDGNTGRLAFMTGAFFPQLRERDKQENELAFSAARAALRSLPQPKK